MFRLAVSLVLFFVLAIPAYAFEFIIDKKINEQFTERKSLSGFAKKIRNVSAKGVVVFKKDDFYFQGHKFKFKKGERCALNVDLTFPSEKGGAFVTGSVKGEKAPISKLTLNGISVDVKFAPLQAIDFILTFIFGGKKGKQTDNFLDVIEYVDLKEASAELRPNILIDQFGLKGNVGNGGAKITFKDVFLRSLDDVSGDFRIVSGLENISMAFGSGVLSANKGNVVLGCRFTKKKEECTLNAIDDPAGVQNRITFNNGNLSASRITSNIVFEKLELDAESMKIKQTKDSENIFVNKGELILASDKPSQIGGIKCEFDDDKRSIKLTEIEKSKDDLKCNLVSDLLTTSFDVKTSRLNLSSKEGRLKFNSTISVGKDKLNLSIPANKKNIAQLRDAKATMPTGESFEFYSLNVDPNNASFAFIPSSKKSVANLSLVSATLKNGSRVSLRKSFGTVGGASELRLSSIAYDGGLLLAKTDFNYVINNPSIALNSLAIDSNLMRGDFHGKVVSGEAKTEIESTEKCLTTFIDVKAKYGADKRSTFESSNLEANSGNFKLLLAKTDMSLNGTLQCNGKDVSISNVTDVNNARVAAGNFLFKLALNADSKDKGVTITANDPSVFSNVQVNYKNSVADKVDMTFPQITVEPYTLKFPQQFILALQGGKVVPGKITWTSGDKLVELNMDPSSTFLFGAMDVARSTPSENITISPIMINADMKNCLVKTPTVDVELQNFIASLVMDVGQTTPTMIKGEFSSKAAIKIKGLKDISLFAEAKKISFATEAKAAELVCDDVMVGIPFNDLEEKLKVAIKNPIKINTQIDKVPGPIRNLRLKEAQIDLSNLDISIPALNQIKIDSIIGGSIESEWEYHAGYWPVRWWEWHQATLVGKGNLDSEINYSLDLPGELKKAVLKYSVDGQVGLQDIDVIHHNFNWSWDQISSNLLKPYFNFAAKMARIPIPLKTSGEFPLFEKTDLHFDAIGNIRSEPSNEMFNVVFNGKMSI